MGVPADPAASAAAAPAGLAAEVRFPASVLFCCDHNAIRSPMAEGMMKKFYGRRAYVQSAGVHNDMEIDGFAIAVCQEIGVELSRHRTRSFEEMRDWGDDLGQFDLIVARDNIVGLQFHPEKSQRLGLAMLGNFLDWRP